MQTTQHEFTCSCGINHIFTLHFINKDIWQFDYINIYEPDEDKFNCLKHHKKQIKKIQENIINTLNK